jgi:hypothetical protein
MAKLNRLKSVKKELPSAFWEQKEDILAFI